VNDSGNQRRLSAILAADMVGYTRLMERDTDGTVAAWKRARGEDIDPLIDAHSGRIVKHTGDGFLAEFPTVRDAVDCAVAMQARLASSPLDFRMGINLGDIIDDGEDIHGEGVNVAARIEALAEPGAVYVSGGVYDQVRNRVEHSFEDMGEHQVKHVSAPVRVYAICSPEKPAEGERPAAAANETPAKTTRIAVPPLQVVGDNDEVTALAEGLRPGIIDGLAAANALTATASEDGKADFVLQGSGRAVGQRLRLIFTLTDAATAAQVWSQRYDRTLDDIFELEDEIAQSVAYMVRVYLIKATSDHLVDRDDAELAWPDLLSKAAGFFTQGVANIDVARAAVAAALEQAPHSTMAHAMTIAAIFRQAELSPLAIPPSELEKIDHHLERVLSLDGAAYFEHLARIRFNPGRILRQRRSSRIRWAWLSRSLRRWRSTVHQWFSRRPFAATP